MGAHLAKPALYSARGAPRMGLVKPKSPSTLKSEGADESVRECAREREREREI